MVTCAYCERPLICEACGADYLPPSAEAYQALSRPDAAVDLPRVRLGPRLPLVQDALRRPGRRRRGDGPDRRRSTR